MVIEVDLSEDIKETKKRKKKEAPKRSVVKRIKSKIKVWQANFSRMPISQKIFFSFFGLVFTGLIGVAIVYSFVILTIPEHQPLDTSFILLEAQKNQELTFAYSLPEPPKIKDQENPINGELYTKEDFELLKERKAIAVIIENHTDARPQAGLSNADLVYETLAESGITRFMAVFWGKDAKKVGPIRSLRTYFIDWSAEYDDPPICNIGQSGYGPWEDVIVPEADALSQLKSYNVKSYDWYGRNVTWRDHDKFNQGTSWEHVAYSSTEKLWEDAEVMNWVGPSGITALKFKKDMLKSKRPLSSKITIKFLNLGAETYKVEWVYDTNSNKYNRFLANEAHIDENNDKQIAAKNVIIQHCKYRATGDKNGRIVLTTIGEGKAQIALDGNVIDGSWKKGSRTERTKFFNADGEEVSLNRGQIWIEVIPVAGTTILSNITIE